MVRVSIKVIEDGSASPGDPICHIYIQPQLPSAHIIYSFAANL